MPRPTTRRPWIFLVHVAFAIAIGLWFSSGPGMPSALAQGLIEVTDDAVQKFYQNGVPHTDGTGNVLTTWQPGASFFPMGAYYPDPCHRSTYVS